MAKQASGWTRRVKWYQGEYDVRLVFTDFDEGREINRFFPVDGEEAQKAYDHFMAGATVLEMHGYGNGS